VSPPLWLRTSRAVIMASSALYLHGYLCSVATLLGVPKAGNRHAEQGTVAASRLTCRSVANIVKEYAGRAGFDAAIFSAHSLRSGFLTSAAAKGASIFRMMDQSGHKSIDTLRGYVRDAELFKDHAGARLL
jgi:site-specific recombinase XerD